MSSNEEIINTLIRLRNAGLSVEVSRVPSEAFIWAALSSTIARNVQLYEVKPSYN
jgi:hypothetical protein